MFNYPNEMMLITLAVAIVIGLAYLLITLRLLAKLRKGTEILTEALQKQGAINAKFESSLSILDRQLEQLLLLEQRLEHQSNDRSYDLAQNMARQGSSVEQVVATCGLSPREAELIVRLHGTQQAEIQAGS